MRAAGALCCSVAHQADGDWLQVAQGEALEISYGALSNDFLLLDYGFLVAGNPHDRVALRLSFELLQARPGEGEGVKALYGMRSCCRASDNMQAIVLTERQLQAAKLEDQANRGPGRCQP